MGSKRCGRILEHTSSAGIHPLPCPKTPPPTYHKRWSLLELQRLSNAQQQPGFHATAKALTLLVHEFWQHKAQVGLGRRLDSI